MNYGNVHAALHQAIGSFQSKQSAADDNRLLVMLCRGQHGINIGDVTESDYTGFVVTRDGNDDRVGTGRKQQPVVSGFLAALGNYLA